jgi:hypothetical protein
LPNGNADYLPESDFDRLEDREENRPHLRHRRRNLMTHEPQTTERSPLLLLTLFLALTLTACGESPQSGFLAGACETLGITDPPAPRRLVVDVICDRSSGSPCTQPNLAETWDAILPALSSRPGSQVRLWLQGEDVSSTGIASKAIVPEFRSHRPRARRSEERTWVASSRHLLLASTRPVWSSKPPRHSPIAEALTKISLTEAPAGSERIVVALTDGREVSSFGDFECGSLPLKDVFLARLAKGCLLAPVSFSNVRVLFAYIGPTPIDDRHCSVTLERTERIKSLWKEALVRAGASEVRFLALAPTLEECDLTRTKGGPTS